jgi:hypothetical protein
VSCCGACYFASHTCVVCACTTCFPFHTPYSRASPPPLPLADAVLQPYLDQIDALCASITKLELVVKQLDTYTQVCIVISIYLLRLGGARC